MSAIAQQTQLIAPPDTLAVVRSPASDWAAVKHDWTELSQASPYASYFVGVDWIGAWIETYGRHLDAEIVRFFDGSRLVAVCMLVSRTLWRGPVPIRILYLNAAGEDQWEEVGAEFNDLLCLSGWEAAVATSLRRHLDGLHWDEFVISGCRRSPAILALRSMFAGCEEQVKTVPSHYVDLNAIRAAGAPFEMSLSYKVRYNIRQSMKLYRETGDLQVHRAESQAEARSMLEELARLHQDRWTKKGRAGAFASARFREFHDAVIARCFDRSQVDILRVSAGQETIGILYNFIENGKAYFYQCGFRFSDNHKLRPGLVTLQMALQWYTDSGLPEFDLMAGNLEYKRSMSKASRPLDWLVVRRPSWRNATLDALHRLRAMAQKAKPVEDAAPPEEQ